MPKIFVSRETLTRAAQSSEVRKALDDRADRVVPRVQRLAADAGLLDFARAVHRENGTRPGTKSPLDIKRPFARVIVDSADALDHEFGNAGVSAQKIMRRAAGSS